LEARRIEDSSYVDVWPPYPEVVAQKPYPANYISPMFLKYDGRTANAKEHVRHFVDTLTAHAHNHDLRKKEFSKSLEGCAFSWYDSLAPGSMFGWNDLAMHFMKKFFPVMTESQWWI
jgi:hypothetical protein